LPTRDEHVAKAEGNESFAFSIKASDQPSIDWTLTALFYAAVHYVEAYLAKHLDSHLRSHLTRDKYIAREPGLRPIWGAYSFLKYYSYNARYEVAGFTGKDMQDAADYLAEVKRHLLPLL
jgi:hypothetical protein